MLLPDQNLPSFPEAIRNQFPVFEKRVDVAEIEVDSDDGDNSDIGNLDDFEDEMNAEERHAWEIRKKLKKELKLVPPRYREQYRESYYNGIGRTIQLHMQITSQ